MINQILFPFDFSAQGLQTVPSVRALARQFGASVTVLSVVPVNLSVLPLNMDDDVARWRQALQSRLDEALSTEFDVPTTRITAAGDPGSCIEEAAQRLGVDLIMMPTHGLGRFRTLLLGSATAKVLHDAKCPVWTAAHAEHERAGGLPQRILCAVDGGPESGALLRWAAEFSSRAGASLSLLHVVHSMTDSNWPESERVIQEKARQAAQDRILPVQAAAGVQAPLSVAFGDIAATVTQRARDEAIDLILIGRGSIQAPLGRLRTHAYGIIQRSPCPVLSV